MIGTVQFSVAGRVKSAQTNQQLKFKRWEERLLEYLVSKTQWHWAQLSDGPCPFSSA